ncbi:MAG TPA: glycosyltransferase [Vicinamibacterales bacterium]|nr:glycosyltransferase [Vicinamibacterales bacterium]
MTALRKATAPPTLARADLSFLASAAAAVAAVVIVLYQAWFIPFFQPFFVGREAFARGVFYTLYGALALTALAAFVTRVEIRRTVMPWAVAAVLGLAAVVLHPIGLVTRAYIIAVVMSGATVVLMLASAPRALLQLTAAVTALNAVLCFVDLSFADGFTNTAGRAAGLAINPNVAAAAILLGAAASHRAVPKRLYASFLVLTAGSIAVTLSRSTMLAAAAAVAIPAVIEMRRRSRAPKPRRTRLEGVRPAAVVAIGLAAWIGLAALTNYRFRWAASEAATDSISFVTALQAAHRAVGVLARDSPSSMAAGRSGGVQPSGGDVPIAGAAPAAGPADASRIAALDERLSSEGGRNSISARTLFLERALLAYRDDGFFGVGLEAAHPLVPHNTFVLFALAFGHLGWLIPLGLVALTAYAARDARDLPLTVAVIGTMATSHDILLTPSLLLPIAIGLGGLIARASACGDAPRLRRTIAMSSAAGVILFALGCLVIVDFSPPLDVERIGPTAITDYRGAYLANVPPQTFAGVFVPAITDGPERTAFLRDDSHPLTRVAWNSGARPVVASGEYSLADGVVAFAPADGSDPRTNGRVVELGLPRQVGASCYALFAALAVWGVGVLLLFRGNDDLADRTRSSFDHLAPFRTDDGRIPILFVIGTLNIGGAETQLVEMVRALDARFAPSVCCLASAGPLADRLAGTGISVTTIGLQSRRQGRGWMRVLPALVRLPIDLFRFVRHVRARQPAVLHGVLMHAYVFGAFAARLSGVPVVVASRRSLSHFKRGKPFMRLAERFANRWTDCVVANSEAVRQDAITTEHLPPEKVTVIYNGLDLDAYDGVADATVQALREELALGASPVVIVVANLIGYKGHEYFLQAWANVCRVHPDAVAIFAGDGPMRAEREEDARALGIETRVRFLGVRRDVPALLAAADLLVHPSLEEGFCNALLEAMAASRPVVATDVGGNREAVIDGETGLLVPPADAGRLAAAILTVLQQPDRGAAWGLAGRRRVVDRFQRSRMLPEYEALYDDLLAQALGDHVRHQRAR